MDREKWGDDWSTNMLAENLTGTCALGVFGFENELMGLAWRGWRQEPGSCRHRNPCSVRIEHCVSIVQCTVLSDVCKVDSSHKLCKGGARRSATRMGNMLGGVYLDLDAIPRLVKRTPRLRRLVRTDKDSAFFDVSCRLTSIRGT